MSTKFALQIDFDLLKKWRHQIRNWK